jgi:hypothetical protein
MVTVRTFFLLLCCAFGIIVIGLARKRIIMSRNRKYLLVVFVLLSSACGSIPQSVAPETQTPIPMQTSQATVAPAPPNATSTATATPTQVPTDTAVPATATAIIDPVYATQAAMMGAFGALMNISQYFNPVGTPVQNWNGAPVMPQATAGQEFKPNIYSYIAAATLDQARKFYDGKVGALGVTNLPATGSSGTGTKAAHEVTYYSYALTIVLTSYDNDTGHVIVVISRVP